VDRASLASMGLIYAGRHKIVREGKVYKVYLASQLLELWRDIAESGKKVEVYVRIAE